MKIYTIVLLLITQLISNRVIAQVDELTFSIIGINSINRLTDESDDNNLFKHFWSPEIFISVEYTTNVFRSDVIFQSGFSLAGMSSSASIKYNNPQCSSGCLEEQSSSYGNRDLGLQLGIGKRFRINPKSNIDLTGGILTRWIFKGGSGSAGGCSDALCVRFLADEESTIDGNIHPSLYAKGSWQFYSNNENNFGLSLTLIYTQGLHSVYRNYTTIRFLQENTEQNYVLENRGSFFGIGLSLHFKRSVVMAFIDEF